ncbi:MAG: PAS domain-containing sensor histidine kinase [Elusimicrobiota bacterium]|nr:MAG: PAS domain-containing sensor histidine kinase [Elusimicrobiota bacterium]
MADDARLLEELRFKSSLLDALNEASINGVLVVDAGGRILSVNKRFIEMWGLAPEALASGCDETALEAVLGKIVDAKGFLERVRHLYGHPDETSSDEILLRDGRVFWRWSAPVLGKDGRRYGRVWHFRDNTELVRAETMRAELKQKRELSALKDQFVGTVSHELRTPLAIVMTAVDSLRKGLAGPLGPRQQEVADVCHRNLQRLNKMINNLLDISRLESGAAKARLERVDLETLARDVEANFRMMGRGRDVALRVEIRGPLPAVRADPELIAQVFDILLDNAERYATRGIVLRLGAESGRAGGHEAAGVRAAVCDDGPGVPPDRVGLLFNKFTQVARAVGGGGYKGTGLGLAICKEILGLHGSTIGVETLPDGGACFSFSFPPGSRARRPSAPEDARG